HRQHPAGSDPAAAKGGFAAVAVAGLVRICWRIPSSHRAHRGWQDQGRSAHQRGCPAGRCAAVVRAPPRRRTEPDESCSNAGEAMSDKLFDLTGQVAIVTGASRGLGQYFARALAKAGADLVLTSRKRETLSAFEKEIEALGRRAVALELDVRDPESIERFAAEADAAFGQIHILVNNAGCNIRKPALEVTWSDWNQILDTNLRGTFFVAQAVARRMIAKGYGRIVNIGSVT